MCFYNTFTYECGCESQPPAFLSSCTPAHPWCRASHSECDRHRHPPPDCRFFIINQERITPGKCSSHRLQAQMEKKVRELKDGIKHLKEDVAEYQCEIDQEEARRARTQGRKGKYRGLGEHARRRGERA